MAKGKEIIKPYRQGAFDSYCGLYSLLNVLSCCLGGRHRISEEHAEALFRHVLQKLQKRKNLLDVATVGVDLADMTFLLPVVAAWLLKKTGDRLHWVRPFTPQVRVRSPVAYRALEVALIAKDCAAIVGVAGPTHHWSVLTRISRKRLILLDSGPLDWIDRKRLFDPKRDKDDDTYRLIAEDTFIVRIDTDHRSKR